MVAKIGEKITFERDGELLRGIVLNVYEKSVCVELDAESAAVAKVHRTVVNHKRYAVKPYERTPEQYNALVADGWSDVRIASVLGITRAKLNKLKKEHNLTNTNRIKSSSLQKIVKESDYGWAK